MDFEKVFGGKECADMDGSVEKNYKSQEKKFETGVNIKTERREKNVKGKILILREFTKREICLRGECRDRGVFFSAGEIRE